MACWAALGGEKPKFEREYDFREYTLSAAETIVPLVIASIQGARSLLGLEVLNVTRADKQSV